MLKTALFAVVTVATLVAVLQGGDGLAEWERAALLVFPAFAAIGTLRSWRDWRRRRSLRTESVDGVTTYVWIDFGQECRSTVDPRPDWDAADGDGDGGGDGGGD